MFLYASILPLRLVTSVQLRKQPRLSRHVRRLMLYAIQAQPSDRGRTHHRYWRLHRGPARCRPSLRAATRTAYRSLPTAKVTSCAASARSCRAGYGCPGRNGESRVSASGATIARPMRDAPPSGASPSPDAVVACRTSDQAYAGIAAPWQRSLRPPRACRWCAARISVRWTAEAPDARASRILGLESMRSGEHFL